MCGSFLWQCGSQSMCNCMGPRFQWLVLWAALLLPAGDEPLAGQAVHGALPAVFLNVPGAHS